MGSPAARINSQRRTDAMKRAGYRVWVVACHPDRKQRDIRLILKYLKRVSLLVIRIDGSGFLDKFTLLKFFNWNVKIIWEIHAFPEENYDMNYPLPPFFSRTMRDMKRRALAFFVHTGVFISEELKIYAETKIKLRNSYVIPNFVLPGEYSSKEKETASPAISALKSRESFIVLWGGLAGLRWQAVDLVEAVAKRIFTVDPSVLFIIIGSDTWHTAAWHKNILAINTLPRKDFLAFVKTSNVCLALYHTPEHTPFYFSPLKILDYMQLGKPVIATRQPPIARIVLDNYNGYLTDNDPKDIIEKILVLKKNRRLLRTMGVRAKRHIARNYSLGIAVQQYKLAFTDNYGH